jgi:cell shape-determining protein MreC
MKSINLARKHHEIINKEFSHVSRQTIYASLKYFNNSDVAQKIRKRALELLEAEIKENEITSLESDIKHLKNELKEIKKINNN